MLLQSARPHLQEKISSDLQQLHKQVSATSRARCVEMWQSRLTCALQSLIAFLRGESWIEGVEPPALLSVAYNCSAETLILDGGAMGRF